MSESAGMSETKAFTGGSRTLNSQRPRAELEEFFHSAEALELKEQICAMGRRQWDRAYVEGNGGNMAIRVGEDLALCTPTQISKGWMKPADICLVDFAGNQLLGVKKRTSEILMHLQMMKRHPAVKASCHCHPPYATAFAVAGITPPQGMLPEYEIFCTVALAPYRAPGSPEMGGLVADLVSQYNTILMANHGVVTWSPTTLEDAYWRMEIIDAYCRTLMVAAQLGRPANRFTGPDMTELLRIKRTYGVPDPRFDLKESELCDLTPWPPVG